jgi:hypothetical protein
MEQALPVHGLDVSKTFLLDSFMGAVDLCGCLIGKADEDVRSR